MTGLVLVVDDVPANVKLLEAKLTNEYYDVVTGKSGFEALDILSKTSVDIVLLDVMMPDMDGFEVCRQIKANPKIAHIPVVMVTALTSIEDRITGLKAGADDFITKPINDVALFARIRSLIRLKLMTDQLRLRNQTGEQFGALETSEFKVLTDTAGALVAIVDDDSLQARQLVEALGSVGHKTMILNHPEVAVETLSQYPADLVIVSMALVSVDGLRLCMQIRAHQNMRHLPILIIAEEEENDLLMKGLDLGVNDYIVTPPDRNELIARSITLIKRKRYQDALKENYQQSVSMAVTDPLTSLYNRRYFDVHYTSIFQQAKEQHKKLSVVMVDIDHFKSINDTYGHQVGDEVLKETAKRLGISLRVTDFVSRYGGEEFVIVLPTTPIFEAIKVAERVLALIAETPITISAAPGSLKVTASLGVASIEETDKDANELMKHADETLYKAKHNGRNRVESYTSAAF